MTDNEYIEKIIKKYVRRKKQAIIYGVIGIVLGMTTFISYIEITEKTSDYKNTLLSFLKEGRELTEHDIRLIKANNELSYVIGTRVGQSLNSFAIGSGISIGYCLYLLFWARKERIILELYEKTKI
ncbi:MAG: hypothetical protein OEY52_02385 [Gammaproteobacteria bacterium]|nr:hypothetical protein [Gammaproteobacteria bacterium]